MSRYHINEKGEPGRCTATVRPCRFGDNESHYSTEDEARKAYEKTVSENGGKKTPILLEPLKFPMPFQWSFDYYRIEEATDSDEIDYYSNAVSDITSIDLDRAIELGTNSKSGDWSDELRLLIDSNRDSWSDPENWELEHGYYEGEGPTLYPPVGMESTLREWYYSNPNAVDPSGALEHVREKGFDTTGQSPADAVKKMLREENGKILKYVEVSTAISKREIKISDLEISKSHYNAIDPREPRPESSNSKEILGVVKLQSGKVRLLDGHHRVKWALTREGKKHGTFLWMS